MTILILETSKPLLLPLFHEPIWVQDKRSSSKKENANKLQEDKVLIGCQKCNMWLFMYVGCTSVGKYV